MAATACAKGLLLRDPTGADAYAKYATPLSKIGMYLRPGTFWYRPSPLRSTWPILPKTRPSGEVMPSMAHTLPLGFTARSMLGAPAAPQVTDALGAAGAGAFWAAGVERIAAMALHMALSILVWMAVSRRVHIWYYFAAVLLHAAANIPAALSQLGLLRSMWCIEGIILAVNAAVCLFVWSVYRKACVHRPLAG